LRVVAPGLRVFAAILERFAERKTDVIAIDDRRGRRSLLAAHACDLAIRKSIRLEIRQAPVRVAKARAHGRGSPIRFDRLRGSAECLQGMTQRQVILRDLRGLGAYSTIDRDGALMLAEHRARLGVQREVLFVPGLQAQQLVELLARLKALLSVSEQMRVVVARRPMVR
jgi:hypothetical protein